MEFKYSYYQGRTETESPKRNGKGYLHKLNVCILIMLILFQFSCQPKHQSEECKNFSKMTTLQIEKEFVAYDLEKQLKLHYCALEWTPASTIYAMYIAQRGQSITPILLEKLNDESYKEKNDPNLVIYGIMLVFENMSEKQEIVEKEEVVKTLEQRISEIWLISFREDAEESLMNIKRNLNTR